MCSGTAVPRCGGAAVCRCDGAPVHWCAGLPVRWCSGAVVQRCGGAAVCQCASAPVHCCARVPVHRCYQRSKYARPIKTKMWHDSAGPPVGKLFVTLTTAPGVANLLRSVNKLAGMDFRSTGGKTVSHRLRLVRCGEWCGVVVSRTRTKYRAAHGKEFTFFGAGSHCPVFVCILRTRLKGRIVW